LARIPEDEAHQNPGSLMSRSCEQPPPSPSLDTAENLEFRNGIWRVQKERKETERKSEEEQEKNRPKTNRRNFRL